MSDVPVVPVVREVKEEPSPIVGGKKAVPRKKAQVAKKALKLATKAGRKAVA